MCNFSVISAMFSCVRCLHSGSNLFLVVTDGLFGVVFWFLFYIMYLCGGVYHSWFGVLFIASLVPLYVISVLTAVFIAGICDFMVDVFRLHFCEAKLRKRALASFAQLSGAVC